MKKRKKSFIGWTHKCWTKQFRWDKKYFTKGKRLFFPCIEKDKNLLKVRITIEEVGE